MSDDTTYIEITNHRDSVLFDEASLVVEPIHGGDFTNSHVAFANDCVGTTEPQKPLPTDNNRLPQISSAPEAFAWSFTPDEYGNDINIDEYFRERNYEGANEVVINGNRP